MSTTSRASTRIGQAGLLLLGLAACQQNVGPVAPPVLTKPAPNPNVGLGFDPGVDLSGTLDLEAGLFGALVPGPTGEPDRRLAFYAFSSTVDAGTLDRDPSPPTDANAASDVFLAAVADTRVTVGGQPQPSIFDQAMVNAFRHPRCVSCHSFHYAGGFGASGSNHPGGASTQSNEGCTDCHDADVGLSQQGPPVHWEAPLLAEHGDLGFGGKTPLQLCTQTKSNTPDPVKHFTTDDKIFWGFERALTPEGKVATGGPAPFAKGHYDELVKAWVQGGCACESASAVRDVVLVSRAAAGNQASGGASRAPGLGFLHNPGFDPDAPQATNPAGWVYVAFESDAADLVAGFVDNNAAAGDVYRARLAVRMDEDAFGLPAPGAVNLVAEPAQTRLVSASTAGATASGNGGSSRPVISAGGGFVAFQSLSQGGANALVAGFADANGPSGSDVYLRDVDNPATVLVSRVVGNQGGNGGSGSAAISPRGDAVAFESLADDLDFADTNGDQDVYCALVDTGTPSVLSLYRASVRSGNLQASGGDSGRPSVFVDPLTQEVLVAFESGKTDLVGNLSGLPATNVYLSKRDPGAGVVTWLLSQVSTSAQAELPDGISSAPTIAPNGRWVAFQTAATNLDVRWPSDENGSLDVLLVDLEGLLATGQIGGRRLSVAAEGVDGQGASFAPLLSAFRTDQSAFEDPSLAAYRASAENLGSSTNTDRNLAFLAE